MASAAPTTSSLSVGEATATFTGDAATNQVARSPESTVLDATRPTARGLDGTAVKAKPMPTTPVSLAGADRLQRTAERTVNAPLSTEWE